MVTSNKERPKEQPNEQSNHDNTDKHQPSSRTLLPPPNHQLGGGSGAKGVYPFGWSESRFRAVGTYSLKELCTFANRSE